MVCWGDNSVGQIGNDSMVQANVPANVVGLSDAIAVSVGHLHSCAVRQTGAVVCWGAGGGGQLGDGRPWWTTPQAVVWPPS